MIRKGKEKGEKRGCEGRGGEDRRGRRESEVAVW